MIGCGGSSLRLLGLQAGAENASVSVRARTAAGNGIESLKRDGTETGTGTESGTRAASVRGRRAGVSLLD